ncbi:terpene synthase-like isoform X1 [Hylaeus anthracinus]|uniref:terpene synthase-like isoform X1 n=1 Tax=Hylaeus anthracinus TaxID=313031 RepID=UPI0023B99F20|nr:terpene synthase-like isoform X1 [Hylaeus anthracinus]
MRKNLKNPWYSSDICILLQPFNYILKLPGKQIRSLLASAFNLWLKIPQDKVDSINDIVNIVHNYTLLIDDIQDNSVLRRGFPVAHSIYGIASTINSANYGSFIALEKVIALGHPEGAQVYTEQLLELHRGQGMEIYWRDNCICPSETAYKHMTLQKSAALFILSIRLMQLFSDCKEDFIPLLETIGYYFQVRDDYFNLYSEKDFKNKIYAEDLSVGNFSFPIVHAIQSHPEDTQIMNILRQRTSDINVKRYCAKLLEDFGSFAYTRNLLKGLDETVRTEVQRLGGNPPLIKVLDKITV